MSRTIFRTLTLLALCALISPVTRASAQGATTSGLTGVVKDPQDAVVPGVTVTAVHQPSSTTYEAVTQTDGRFFIPGHESRRTVHGHRHPVGIPNADSERHHAESRRGPGCVVQADAGDDLGGCHRDRSDEPDLCVDANRRCDVCEPKRSGDLADGFRTHQRHRATRAAVRRHRERSPARTTG